MVDLSVKFDIIICDIIFLPQDRAHSETMRRQNHGKTYKGHRLERGTKKTKCQFSMSDPAENSLFPPRQKKSINVDFIYYTIY